jgi:hypothetical protein
MGEICERGRGQRVSSRQTHYPTWGIHKVLPGLQSGKLGKKGKRMRGGDKDLDVESSLAEESASTMVSRLSTRVRGPSRKANKSDPDTDETASSSRQGRRGKDVAVNADAYVVVLVEADMEHDESGYKEKVEQEVKVASDNDEDTSPIPINDDTPQDVVKDITEKQHLQLTPLTRELKDLKNGHTARGEHHHALLRPLQEFRASSSSSIDGVPRNVEAGIEKPWQMGLPVIERYTREMIEAARASILSDANLQR